MAPSPMPPSLMAPSPETPPLVSPAPVLFHSPQDDQLLDENEAEEMPHCDELGEVNKQWDRLKKTFPKFRDYWPVHSKTVDVRTWPSWFYNTPDPIMRGLRSTRRDLGEGKGVFTLPSTKVYTICSHTFFPTLMNGIKMKCLCGSNDTQMNGWTPGYRVAIGISEFCLVKAHRYVHLNCPLAHVKGNNRTILAVYTDNPISDCLTMRKHFGPSVKVLKDIFYCTDDFFGQCNANSNLRGSF